MRIIAITLFTCLGFNALSQSIVLKTIEGTILNDDTLKLVHSYEDYDITFDLNVYNTSNVTKAITLDRIEEDVLPNTSSYFCWSVCTGVMTSGDYPVFSDPGSLNVGSNPSATGNSPLFTFHHDPNFNVGTSLFKVKFYDANNPSDSSIIYLELTTRADLSLSEQDAVAPTITPNPASDIVTISNYQDVLEICDVSGKKMELPKQATMDIHDWNIGVYFVRFRNGYVKKIIKE